MIARTEFPAFDQNCLVATAKHVTPHSCPNWIEVHVGTALNPSTTHVAGSAVEFCRLYRLLGRRQADENSFPCATILDSLKQSSSRTPTANMEWKRSNLPSRPVREWKGLHSPGMSSQGSYITLRPARLRGAGVAIIL
jgi:hypothetical protein